MDYQTAVDGAISLNAGTKDQQALVIDGKHVNHRWMSPSSGCKEKCQSEETIKMGHSER